MSDKSESQLKGTLRATHKQAMLQKRFKRKDLKDIVIRTSFKTSRRHTGDRNDQNIVENDEIIDQEGAIKNCKRNNNRTGGY